MAAFQIRKKTVQLILIISIKWKFFLSIIRAQKILRYIIMIEISFLRYPISTIDNKIWPAKS